MLELVAIYQEHCRLLEKVLGAEETHYEDNRVSYNGKKDIFELTPTCKFILLCSNTQNNPSNKNVL